MGNNPSHGKKKGGSHRKGLHKSNETPCQGCGAKGIVNESGYCNQCKDKKVDDEKEKEKDKDKDKSPEKDFVLIRRTSLDRPAWKPPVVVPPAPAFQVPLRASSTDKGLSCPICMELLNGLSESDINNHIDECLAKQMLENEGGDLKACKSCSVLSVVNTLGYCASCTNEYQRTHGGSGGPSTPIGGGRNDLLVSSTNPFKVSCPYYGCYTPTMEASAFPNHVINTHAAASSHKFSCPVCYLITGENYPPNENTNLLEHVRNKHQEFLGNQPPPAPAGPVPPKLNPSDFVDDDAIDYSKFIDDDNDDVDAELLKKLAEMDKAEAVAGGTTTTTTTTTKTAVITPPHVGSRFVEEVLAAPLEKECSICFEDFAEGATIARLECFCIFHKDCILEWFKKSNHKCPLHQD